MKRTFKLGTLNIALYWKFFLKYLVLILIPAIVATSFIYFYIVRAWPHLYAAYLALFHAYSLFAMLAFTVAPVVVGALWHRRRKLPGLHLLLNPKR